MNIFVIGAGASGLVASIYASQKGKVTILEKNKMVGKKLNITGNGKCNFLNDDFSTIHYNQNIDFLINEDGKNKVLNLMKKIGVSYYQKNGYYYPLSNQAITITNALLKEALINKVNIEYETEVEDIRCNNSGFEIITNKGIYHADKLIIASGSCAFKKTGSDGKLYNILKKLGHHIKDVKPALVSLKTDKVYKDISGVRTNAIIKMDDKEISGEVQFTNYGLSGICIFNISRNALNKKIYIDLLPNIDILSYLNETNKIVKERNISELLDGLLNYKLTNLILKLSNIQSEEKFDMLSKKQLRDLEKNIKNLEYIVVGTNDFDSAQTCTGGVSLNDIDHHFKSKIVDNLYIIGEILDVDGECGGYNLAFAFLSGMESGKCLE